MGESTKNSAVASSGASASSRSQRRKVVEARYATIVAALAAAATTRYRLPPKSMTFFTIWATKTASNSETRTRSTRFPRPRRKRLVTNQTTNGGMTTRATAKIAISRCVKLRETKASGLSAKRSSSGWDTAMPHAANNSTNAPMRQRLTLSSVVVLSNMPCASVVGDRGLGSALPPRARCQWEFAGGIRGRHSPLSLHTAARVERRRGRRGRPRCRWSRDQPAKAHATSATHAATAAATNHTSLLRATRRR